MLEIKDFDSVKPILKWAGGKRDLVNKIKPFYESLGIKNYFEPFFGGGAVYFDILKTFGSNYSKKSIINDINTDLIELYRNIKSNPKEIIYHCKELEKDFYKYDYYHIRDRFNGVSKEKEKVERYDGIIRSSALILLNRTCFNGLYRVNQKGLFNVPKGNYKNPRIVDEDNLFLVSELLPQKQNILNDEFDKLEMIEKNDLVYFDPPYHPLSNTSSFTSYSGSFGEKEQIRLRDYFKILDEKKVLVILSNSSSEFIKDIYSEFKIIEVFAKRNINSNSNKRGKISELIILGNTLKDKI
mgnify:FL=1|tara:strand:+ start:6577 stop:7470 length:894 start_codon:yes stop_codon:yes gene_type:complete